MIIAGILGLTAWGSSVILPERSAEEGWGEKVIPKEPIKSVVILRSFFLLRTYVSSRASPM